MEDNQEEEVREPTKRNYYRYAPHVAVVCGCALAAYLIYRYVRSEVRRIDETNKQILDHLAYNPPPERRPPPPERPRREVPIEEPNMDVFGMVMSQLPNILNGMPQPPSAEISEDTDDEDEHDEDEDNEDEEKTAEEPTMLKMDIDA